jgi:hypothetical protein
MKNQILTIEKIKKIVDQADQTRYEAISNIQVEETLLIMLKVTHLFKSEMDRKSVWYQTFDRLEAAADNFYDLTGWKGMERGKNKINVEGPLLFHTNIQNLLLQTLYALNGSDYKPNDPVYDLEDIFDKIFEGVPKGREFDIEIIRFLLLPIYNSSHNTNYEMSEILPASS